jgi:glycosyltransferase involved in cell wall biosynthesis
MRLLICTQVVDRDDLYLGFFHGWIEEMAQHFEYITVLCLKEGVHVLPKNVEVLSLGKEKGTSRVTRALRVLRWGFSKRNNYDAVLVHMNQEYILLAGWLWKCLGKKIYMWRNHYAGTWQTDIAIRQCNKIFCTSKFSYTAKFSKNVFMPVGVDTDLYAHQLEVARDPHAVLFYARMAPSKKAEVLLKALGILHARSVSFVADFYGSPLPKYEPYLIQMKTLAQELSLDRQVRFFPGAPHSEGPRIFSAHTIFVDLGASGMYNKMLFEAAACECLVVAASRDFAKLVDERFIFQENDAEDLADKIESLLKLPVVEQRALGAQLCNIAKSHSLHTLGIRLAEEIV